MFIFFNISKLLLNSSGFCSAAHKLKAMIGCDEQYLYIPFGKCKFGLRELYYSV